LRPGIFSLRPLWLCPEYAPVVDDKSPKLLGFTCVVNPGWEGGSFYLDEYLSSAAKANLLNRIFP